MVLDRYALCNADNERNLGSNRLDNRIRRQSGWHKDRGGIHLDACIEHLLDRIEHRPTTEVFGATLAGRDAGATLVPMSSEICVWTVDALPVKPCTITLE